MEHQNYQRVGEKNKIFRKIAIKRHARAVQYLVTWRHPQSFIGQG